MGRKRFARVGFLSPLPGLGGFGDDTHGFTVGYYLSRLRRWVCRAEALAKAGAQILFQPGEGGLKGVVVLPVREIGEVIFADFFRQIFAGVSSGREVWCGRFPTTNILNYENNSCHPETGHQDADKRKPL